MSIFEEFDRMVDVKALAEEVEKAGDSIIYKDVPDGKYEVKIEKMEMKLTKDNTKMMLSVWFKILTGEMQGQRLFMNQVLMEQPGVGAAVRFLKSLGSSQEVVFRTYTQFNDLVMNIMEEIDGKYEYCLEYGHNKNGYGTFKIDEIYELE